MLEASEGLLRQVDQWSPIIVDTPFLLPLPKGFHRIEGFASIGCNSALSANVTDPRVEKAVARWRSGLAAVESPASIHIHEDSTVVSHAQGYRIEVRPAELVLTGGAAAGCFHGLATLRQLQHAETARIPCGAIDDHPDFAVRGILHDVTRGKVPKLETLKQLVDRLADLKINQLQLYIEHAFVFSFDPEICNEDDGLTPDEVRELDGYARDRFIDLVPAVASFGHMGRILSMPKYRHLAEIEATCSWGELAWPKRARGFTLDCQNPEGHALVERIWSEILDAFSSPVVNICGDEPWDLGRGKNRHLCESGRIGEAYVEQITRTHRICASRGRRTQYWGDIIRNYPDWLDRLDKDSTILHWGYEGDADYDDTNLFVQAGFDTMVCPGTSGWKRVVNALDLAERNISTFARAGLDRGACGLLNTDWGDHGHFNQLACSWHGIALGAAMGWSVDHPTGRRFDDSFVGVLWGVPDTAGVAHLRRMSSLVNDCETWRILWMPMAELVSDPSLPHRDQVEEAKLVARQARAWFERAGEASITFRQEAEEIATACAFFECFAEKAAVLRGAGNEVKRNLAVRLEHEVPRLGAHWAVRNKPSGWQDIEQACAGVMADVECFEG